MLRNRLSLFVLVLLLLTSLTALAQDAEVAISPVACTEPGSLTMWVWDQNWQTVIGDSIEVWKEKYCPGAEVELIQQPWGQYWDLLRTNAAGGELPDVFNMSQVFFDFYANNGALLDLQPYWEEYGVDTGVWGTGMVDPYRVGEAGDLYAGPVNWDTIALLYNKDLFDAAGVAYPTADWTWNDFADAAAKLTNPEEDIYGAVAYVEYQAGYSSWIASTGTTPVVSDDGATCTLTEPGSLEALNFLKSLYDQGYMPSVSTLGGSNADDAYNFFASGKAAMVTAGSWKLPEAVEGLTFNWDIAPLPSNPDTGLSRSSLHAVGYVAAANSDVPDLAANLILFLSSDEGQQFFADAGGVAPANPNPDLQAQWAEAFADSGKNIQAYIDATTDSQGISLFGEIWDTANTELVVNIFDLNMDVEEAAQLACDTIDQQIAAVSAQ
ncbi:MAG: sugar ABC transporter substrate-binding protein [Anaerolineae bacterium]|nr:sugar ABC transporter substrate-binding protein [Anaerolineae bacterium]